MTEETKIIVPEERFKQFQQEYQQKPSRRLSVLIMGLYGVGKTRFITTGRKPILIDSFDPNGTIVIEQLLGDEIKKGNILIRTFWNDSSKNPTEHERWEAIFQEDKESGFFNYFGTYAIDSFTTWLDAVANRVSYEMGRINNPKNPKLAIQDYPIIYDYAKDVVKSMSAFDCDFVVTAHLDRYQEDATGQLVTDIRTYKALRTELPLLFTEKYVLETKQVPRSEKNPNGIEYNLYTSAAGTFRASTQLGANGRLKPVEEPNLKKILEKVGFDSSDKPSLMKGE